MCLMRTHSLILTSIQQKHAADPGEFFGLRECWSSASMTKPSHRRLQRWCAMALLESYEAAPSEDPKSAVISVLDEVLAIQSNPVSIDHEIAADERLLRGYVSKPSFPDQHKPNFENLPRPTSMIQSPLSVKKSWCKQSGRCAVQSLLRRHR